MFDGNAIFDNQSVTVSLLQPSVAQVPLFLHPRGIPEAPEAQPLHPIFSIYKAFSAFEKGRKLNYNLSM
jgi:hypothetical protein